jgi:hypothetical protein
MELRQQHLRTLLVAPFAAAAFVDTPAAQVVIPFGDFGDSFEKYLVAGIAFVLLCVAVWRFFRNR